MMCYAMQLVLALVGTTCICFFTNMVYKIGPIFAATSACHGGGHLHPDLIICPFSSRRACSTSATAYGRCLTQLGKHDELL